MINLPKNFEFFTETRKNRFLKIKNLKENGEKVVVFSVLTLLKRLFMQLELILFLYVLQVKKLFQMLKEIFLKIYVLLLK